MHRSEQLPQPGVWESWLEASVASLHQRSLFRTLRPTVPGQSAVEAAMSQADVDAWVGGRPPATSSLTSLAEAPGLRTIKLFSLNDYLGLSTHPAVRKAAAEAALACGNGPRSSALVGGYTCWHAQLEAALAKLKGTQDCLLFPTGFAANLAVASAVCEGGSSGGGSAQLAKQQGGQVGQAGCGRSCSSGSAQLAQHPQQQQGGQGGQAVSRGGSSGAGSAQHAQHAQYAQQQQQQQVVLFSDELNHASIVDGARLGRRAGARLLVYRHNDLEHLEQLLQGECTAGARAVVITDSLFSMDGDFADLRGLAALRRKHGFLLVVDEAHATLVCGDHGGGAAEEQGVAGEVDMHVGTLRKAFGGLGGFVACSRRWKEFLVNRGRAQVYSTALPVPVVASAMAALQVAAEEPWRRQRVWQLAQRLGRELGVPVSSPIVPLVIGPEQLAVDASLELLQRGFHVPAIRPPTVPSGTSRLRVSLSAAHSDEDVRQLVEAIRACGLTFLQQPTQQQQQQGPEEAAKAAAAAEAAVAPMAAAAAAAGPVGEKEQPLQLMLPVQLSRL